MTGTCEDARSKCAGRRRLTRQLEIESLEPRCVLAALSLSDFYTAGKGSGLHMQELEGFALSTTQSTRIAGGTSNSALMGSPGLHETGASPVREGFEFSATNNILRWDVEIGGEAPWLIRPELVGQAGAVQNLVYPKFDAPDSAATATALFTGTKTFNGAIGVDVFERPAESIAEIGRRLGKSSGVISSVVLNHATPAAAVSHHNRRGDRDDEFPAIDNTLQQALLLTKPTVYMGAGHPVASGFSYVRESTYFSLRDPADGRYDDWTLVERGPNAVDRLIETATAFDPESGRQLLGLFGGRRQGGNLPWASANSDFSNAGRGGRRSIRPLLPGETDAGFIAQEQDENPRLFEMTDAALRVLEKDEDGFWLMVEGGDIDWAMHNNSLDNAVGAVLELDLAVKTAMDWIDRNGGFEENLLIVTADHDHYLTLNNDYPEIVAAMGVEAMTPTDLFGDPIRNGHFWGSDPLNQFNHASHTSIPVPVYYQGPVSIDQQLRSTVGQGYTAYGVTVEGVPGMIDQVHVFDAMRSALVDSAAKNVIIMVGDGMGWEMTRAAAIAKQIESNREPRAFVDESGALLVSGTPAADSIILVESQGMIGVESAGRGLPIEVGGENVSSVDRDTVSTFRFVGRQSQDNVLARGVSLDIFSPGDANRDLQFNQLDIILVLQGGKYITGEASTWAEGDWNGDGLFNQFDLVSALISGGYLV